MLNKDEIWKEIPNYEGKYHVSNFGRIKSIGWDRVRSLGRRTVRLDKILKTHITKFGYERVELNKNGVGKKFVVHRLVALVFVDNPENKPEVNHIDGNKLNNFVENLEWNTSKENIRHAVEKGLNVAVSGDNHCCAKLTRAQALEIKDKFDSGEYKNQTFVAKSYNVSRSAIWQIVHGKSWKA